MICHHSIEPCAACANEYLARDQGESDYLTAWHTAITGPPDPWDLDARLGPDTFRIQTRDHLILRYAWSIPWAGALDAIQQHAPDGIVEVCAGSGYWAYLLRARGIRVDATDTSPLPHPWTKVLRSDAARAAAKHARRTLLLSWPPYNDPSGADAIRAYREAGGQTLAYIGECNGGCTGDDSLYEELDAHWVEVECVPLPQWPGVRDDLTIYRSRHRRLPGG